MTARAGVLLLDLGGPASPVEVRPFLRDLLSEPAVIGLPRPLSTLLASWIAARRWRLVAAHYEAIGGRSPIHEGTAALAAAVAARLGAGISVRHAFALSAPRIPDEVAGLVASGARRIVALPLFPQESRSTTGVVLGAAARAARGRAELVAVRSHAEAPGYVEALAQGILARLDGADRVIASAHGLPQKIARRDGYVAEVERTVAALGRRLAGRAQIALAYQSRLGRAEWTRPYLLDEIARAAAEGTRRLVVAPISFACENLETRYELDLELPPLARAAGAESIARAPAPGAHPAYAAALAELAGAAAERPPEARRDA